MNDIKFCDGNAFCDIFRSISIAVHRNALIHGWWGHSGKEDRNFGEMIALMHSELSEALEAQRCGNPPDKHCPDLSSVEVEFADVIIRMMDTAAALGLRVPEAILAKHQYNISRPYLHGKEF